MIMYEYFSKDSRKLPIIRSIGYADNTLVTRYGPISRNYYIIHYVLSGKGYYNGCPVVAGQGFISMPKNESFYTYDEQDPWSYIWFTTYDDDILPFIEMHKAENLIFSYHNIDALLSISNYIRLYGENLCTSSQFSELFAKVVNNCIYTRDLQVSSAKKQLYYAMKYIDMHLDQVVSVNQICDILGITQSYLHRIFNNEFGISPKQYITQKKINQAKAMLSESNASITSIANALGFYNSSSFTKYFKAHVGVSPKEFRLKTILMG